jgi:3-oxoacid CoA-transferase subunit A
MFYITGDTHGNFYRVTSFIHRHNLTAHDTIIILGDAGFNFYGLQDMRDVRNKDIVNAQNVPIFCVHGNHEMRPATLSTYKQKVWNGGIVWYEPEYPNLLFAKDGEVYYFDGKSVMVAGGAWSVDWKFRIKHNPEHPHWWPDEQPSDEIKKDVAKAIKRMHNHIDIILTHTCPLRYLPLEALLDCVDQEEADQSTEVWLDEVERSVEYERWYCGHYHINKHIDKVHFLFKEFECLQ